MSKANTRTLPDDFLNRLEQYFGRVFANLVLKTALSRPTTFRVNTLKAHRAEVIAALQSAGFKLQYVSWYKDAFILKNKSKRELMDTEQYMSGKIYLQSLASMVPPLALAPEPGEKVLDLTAAPGSKTSQIAALMNATGQLVANDNNKIRFFKLKHNLDLLSVTAKRPGWDISLSMQHGVGFVKKYKNYFDKILLDAPCSAEARFIAGDSTTYGYWSERKVREMAYKQRQLLLSSWGALKPGGVLVYSTCTFSPEENEFQINRLLERFSDAEVLPLTIEGVARGPLITESKKQPLRSGVARCLRLNPNTEIEGFFIAKIKKKS